MQIVRTPDSARAIARTLPRPLGLVPTMGALHAGHLSLVERAREENVTVAALDLRQSAAVRAERGFRALSALLRGRLQAARSGRRRTALRPEPRGDVPEGLREPDRRRARSSRSSRARLRPGHFVGVCTVVAKLLHALEPTSAYFGQKDAQQTAVVRRMVRDLDLPARIVVCKTVREPDGLALSEPQRLSFARGAGGGAELPPRARSRLSRDPRRRDRSERRPLDRASDAAAAARARAISPSSIRRRSRSKRGSLGPR